MLHRVVVIIAAVVLIAGAVPADRHENLPVRRLNSLVTELADVQFAGHADGRRPRPTAAHEVVVTAEAPCWLYVRLEGRSFGDRLWVTMDAGGERTRIIEGLTPGETMREVAAGEVTFTVWEERRARAGRLIVRRVPEIMMYMYEGQNDPSPQRWNTHSWELYERSVLPSVSLVVSHQRPAYEPFARRWHARGGRWIVNHGMGTLRDRETDPARYWADMLGGTPYGGAIHDELLFQDAEHFERYAQGLRDFAQMPESEGRRIYLFAPRSVVPGSEIEDNFIPDEDAPHSGQRCLLAVAQEREMATARQLEVRMEPGREYTLSAWMRGEDVRNRSYTGVFIIDEGWYHRYAELKPVEGDSGWRRYQATFTPQPSRNELYQVVLMGPGEGTLVLDDIQLEAGAEVGQFASGAPNLLANPGFEDGLTHWMRGSSRFAPLREAALETGAVFAPEMYLHEQPTLAAAREAIEGGLVQKVQDWRGRGLHRRMLLTLSAGNCALRYSNDRLPDVNYKVHLDMQMHAMATEEAFEDVWGVGLWSAHYLDEELVRWYGALWRHYCIEGRRGRLARDPYMLDHLSNPGFEDGLEWWETSGSSEVVPVSGMPEGARGGRHAPVPQGEMVLHTVRDGDEGSSWSQPIRNLEPGRLYSLKLYCANPEYSEELIPAEIALEGVEVLPERTLAHIWQSGETHWTMHYRVFRATATEGRLTIGDAAAGEVYWDFVQVEPYFEG